MTNITTDSNNNLLIAAYKALYAKYMSDTESIRQVLSSTTDHPFWKELGDLLLQYNNDDDDDDASLQALLNLVFAQQQEDVYGGSTFSTKVATSIRAAPKRAARVRAKLHPVPAHRSNFADWMACRVECRHSEFAVRKQQIVRALATATTTTTTDAIVVVWRYDYENLAPDQADLMHMGYAYRPGALAIMEIQVLEPIAAWVFTSNSLHKHHNMTGRVTFKESKDLYKVIKTAILSGTIPHDDSAVRNVIAYYQEMRQRDENNNCCAANLDLEALAELQSLIDERFGWSSGNTKDSRPLKTVTQFPGATSRSLESSG